MGGKSLFAVTTVRVPKVGPATSEAHPLPFIDLFTTRSAALDNVNLLIDQLAGADDTVKETTPDDIRSYVGIIDGPDARFVITIDERRVFA